MKHIFRTKCSMPSRWLAPSLGMFDRAQGWWWRNTWYDCKLPHLNYDPIKRLPDSVEQKRRSQHEQPGRGLLLGLLHSWGIK